MCDKVDCNDHTPEQRKVVEDFDKLIAKTIFSKSRQVGIMSPSPKEQLNAIVEFANNGSEICGLKEEKSSANNEDCTCFERLDKAQASGDSEEIGKILSNFYHA